MTTENFCKHHNVGYCKNQNKCRFFLATKDCEKKCKKIHAFKDTEKPVSIEKVVNIN